MKTTLKYYRYFFVREHFAQIIVSCRFGVVNLMSVEILLFSYHSGSYLQSQPIEFGNIQISQ